MSHSLCIPEGSADQITPVFLNPVFQERGSTDDSPCLGNAAKGPDSTRIASGSLEFVAVSGFLYVVDFVRWWADANNDEK